jgi:hypothetical protein
MAEPDREYDNRDIEASADNTSRFIDRIGGSYPLTPVLIICLLGLAALWLLVLAAPSTVGTVLDFLLSDSDSSSSSSNGAAWLVIFGLPFGLAFMVVYSIARSRHPDIENESEIKSGMMAGYAYRQKTDKRWRVWVLAGMAGACNWLLLFLFYGLRS